MRCAMNSPAQADAVAGGSGLATERSSFAEVARWRLGLCVLLSFPEALTPDSCPRCFCFPIPHRLTGFFWIVPPGRSRIPLLEMMRLAFRSGFSLCPQRWQPILLWLRPGRPVVRVNVPASGAFLRTKLRRNLDHEFSGSIGLARKKENEHSPPGRQDRLVGTGLGPGSVFDMSSGLVFFRIRLLRRSPDPEILDNEEAPFRIGGKGVGGLVDPILPDLFMCRRRSGPDASGSASGSAIVFAGGPVSCSSPCQRFRLRSFFSIRVLWTGRRSRLIPSLAMTGLATPGRIPRFCYGVLLPRPSGVRRSCFLFRRDLPIVREEGAVPSSLLDRDRQRGGSEIGPAGDKRQDVHRELFRPETKLSGIRFAAGPEGEKFGGDPDRSAS